MQAQAQILISQILIFAFDIWWSRNFYPYLPLKHSVSVFSSTSGLRIPQEDEEAAVPVSQGVGSGPANTNTSPDVMENDPVREKPVEEIKRMVQIMSPSMVLDVNFKMHLWKKEALKIM